MGVPFRWDHGDEAFETEHCMCRPSAVPIRSAQRRRTSATDRAISVARRSGGPRGYAIRGRRGQRRVDRSTECRRCSRRNVDAALGLAHAVRVSGTPWPVSRVTPPVNPTNGAGSPRSRLCQKGRQAHFLAQTTGRLGRSTDSIIAVPRYCEDTRRKFVRTRGFEAKGERHEDCNYRRHRADRQQSRPESAWARTRGGGSR